MSEPSETNPPEGARHRRLRHTMVEAVRQGRVTYLRVIAGSAAPDFYRYEWHLDGARVNQQQRVVLERLAQDFVTTTGSFAGIIGPAQIAVTLTDLEAGVEG